MSFIRPEALRSLRKYRGFIFAGLVLTTGLMIVVSRTFLVFHAISPANAAAHK